MWGGKSTYINGTANSIPVKIPLLTQAIVTFAAGSQGQLALVIYEWADSKYLGKVIDPNASYMPVSGEFEIGKEHSRLTHCRKLMSAPPTSY